MNKELIFVLIVGLALLAFDYQRPGLPSEVITAEVVAVEDAPEGKGWRLVTVDLPDGSRLTVKTLAPFFYKAGYPAYVGVFKHRIFPDELDLVSSPSETSPAF